MSHRHLRGYEYRVLLNRAMELRRRRVFGSQTIAEVEQWRVTAFGRQVLEIDQVLNEGAFYWLCLTLEFLRCWSLIHAHVIHRHLFWKSGGRVRVTGPIAAYG